MPWHSKVCDVTPFVLCVDSATHPLPAFTVTFKHSPPHVKHQCQRSSTLCQSLPLALTFDAKFLAFLPVSCGKCLCRWREIWLLECLRYVCVQYWDSLGFMCVRACVFASVCIWTKIRNLSALLHVRYNHTSIFFAHQPSGALALTRDVTLNHVNSLPNVLYQHQRYDRIIFQNSRLSQR